jgi:hypothetical protein
MARRLFLAWWMLLGWAGGEALAAQSVPTAPDVRFVVAEGVAPEDEWLVREGVRFAHDFVATHLGAAVQTPFTVEIGTNPDPPSSAYAGGNTIVVSPAHRVWLDSSPLNRVKIIVHEYFHLVQFGLTRNMYDPGPIWLLEGSAELVGFRAVADASLVSFEAVLDRWIAYGLQGPLANTSLADIESATASPDLLCCMYELAPMAVHLLVEDRGLAALGDYYGVIGNGMPWREAFASAFGMSVEEFYASFDAARYDIGVAGHDQRAVAYPSFVSGGAGGFDPAVLAAGALPGDQVMIAGTTAPGASCQLGIAGDQGRQVATLGTWAGIDGMVFWLWTVPADLPPQLVDLRIDCGNGDVSYRLAVG